MPDFRPLALLAFSKDPDNPLPGVADERVQLIKLLDGTGFTPLESAQVDEDWLIDKLRKYGDPQYGERIHLFHFSGHASPHSLYVNASVDDHHVAQVFSDALAHYIRQSGHRPKLVFLNGCATHEQAQAYLKNGVEAVIYTTRPVGDYLAARFSVHFYQEFVSLQGGVTLQQAFERAWTRLNLSDKSLRAEAQRGNYAQDLDDGPARNLYELAIAADSTARAETFAQWSSIKGAPAVVPVVEDVSKIKTMGVHPKSYLLCNRVAERNAFQNILAERLSSQDPHPIFVFVHDDQQHLPLLVSEWLDEFGLSTFFAQEKTVVAAAIRETRFFHDIPIDDSSYVDAPIDVHLHSEMLRDAYLTNFEMAGANQFSLRLPEKQPLLVVHHKFFPEGWIEDNRQQDWGALLDFYIQTLAAELAGQFSPRLVVCFSLKYNYAAEQNAFKGLIAAAQQRHPNRKIYDIQNLKPLRPAHIDAWVQEVFKDTWPEYDVTHFFPDPTPLPFNKVLTKLRTSLEEYAKRIA